MTTLARSALADSLDRCTLYQRRQIGSGVLALGLRTQGRSLRLVDPDLAEVLESFAALLDGLQRHGTAQERYLEGMAIVDRFRSFARMTTADP